MKKNANIELQGFYTCKAANNKVVTVQILASSPKGGWEAANVASGKKIYIAGPEKLIKKVSAPKEKAKAEKPVSKEKAKGKEISQQIKPAKPAKAEKKDGKLSMLEAAEKVLEKESPLGCRQMVERMAEAGLWKTDAATPANTLHAALSKEVRVKGAESRFEKADRGKFGLKTKK